MSRLVNNIEKRMRQAGFTQKSLALKAGLNETAVRDILKGRSKDPQYSTLNAIARTLKCTIEDLYRGPGRRPDAGLSDDKRFWPSGVGAEAQEAGNGNDPAAASPAGEFAADHLFLIETEVEGASSPAALSDGRARRHAEAHYWQVPVDAVMGRKTFEGLHSKLRILPVQGDSMAPDFQSGDRVLVNLTDNNPSPAGIFLLWDGAGFVIRRCEIVPNSKPLRLIQRARNPDYGAHEGLLKDATVCGRVIAHWRKV